MQQITAYPGQELLDLSSSEILAALRQSGAALLRGFQFPDASFVALTERFSSRFFAHGKRAAVLDRYSIEVVPGSERVAPHCELGYLPFPASYLWLLCRTPAEAGGRTMVLDGHAFFTALSKATQELLLARRIVYHHRWSTRLQQGFWPGNTVAENRALLAAQPGVLVLPDFDESVLRFDYLTSALRTDGDGTPRFLNSVLNLLDVMRKGDANATVLFEDGEPFSRALVDELESVATAVQQLVSWQPRDILFVDNQRALHGREAFRGTRDVVVRIGMNKLLGL